MPSAEVLSQVLHNSAKSGHGLHRIEEFYAFFYTLTH